MGCSCSDPTDDHGQKVDELLGSVGLKEVVGQGHEAIAEAGRALGHLNRSERATLLGFGSEVAGIQSGAATRTSERAREQVQTVLDRLDHVRRGDDWPQHVERVRSAFQKRGGGGKRFEDLRADLRLRMLDDNPGLSASVAELSLTMLDGAIKAGSEGDLDKVADQMRRIMQYALRVYATPEMGRDQVDLGMLLEDRGNTRGRPPMSGGADSGWCAALGICLAWAYSSLIASLIVCFAVPFCWCCFHLAVLGTFMLHQFACIAAFANACNRP